MASLQDQLLKAGLVDKRKAKIAKQEKQKQASHARKTGGKTVNAAKAAAEQQRVQRIERDRVLNQQKQEASRQKEIAAQVRQLIEVNRLERDKAEISYSFVYRNKVKNIQVTEDQKKHLTQGHLAIVISKTERFEIVPMQVAQKISERDAQSVVQLNDRVDDLDPADDPYADYQIPDNLTW
ncbi:MAG: DUF2058 domain-containing protein [Gammaproteobacteria bacterium]|nr:DUF2058 domain-containing protein [Gammaproteobacteria bacterium]